MKISPKIFHRINGSLKSLGYRPENRLSFYAVTDAFLAEHLGGRYEPIGDDFEGSSVTVPVGAEEVPGLAEALSE